MKARKLTALAMAGAMAATMCSTAAFAEEAEAVTIDSIVLGEDYTDLEASIKVLTHRTDLVENEEKGFPVYLEEFHKLYPSIEVEYEAVTDYAEDIKIRLTTDDWGDICMIPTSLNKNELADEFISFGEKEKLDELYVMLNNFTYDGQVYGIPSTGNAQGVVYNKKVFEAAGIEELPKTPSEFIAALQLIKDNTDAIPLYTNFAAGWTMGAWDAYIGGSATGDADFMNYGLVHGENPFADNGQETGPFAVYNVLYEVVKQGLTEDDPTTTDWEGCKGMINGGEIGCMVLGSWAVTQMQEAGPNAEDIGYMPFPISIDGKQYASAGPDYCYGINVHTDETNQLASMIYVKWLTEESGFSYNEGGIPINVGGEYPSTLDSFAGVELVVDNPAPAGEEDLFGDINTESEVGLNMDNTHVCNVLECALDGSKTMEEIAAEWNEAWADAQADAGVEPVAYEYGAGIPVEE